MVVFAIVRSYVSSSFGSGFMKEKATSPALLGSGSFQEDTPFQIVAMKKQIQTNNVHKLRCGRKRAFCEQNGQGAVEAYNSIALHGLCAPVSLPTWVSCSRCELLPDRHSKNLKNTVQIDRLLERYSKG